MKLSRSTDFSLRILLHLAKVGEKATNNELSKKLKIPSAYLVKLVRELARQNYLRTSKGKGGGVELVKNPNRINLLEIVELNEGPIVLSDCFIDKRYCTLDPSCSLKGKIGSIQKEIKRLLSETSVGDLLVDRESHLVSRKKTKNGIRNTGYEIREKGGDIVEI